MTDDHKFYLFQTTILTGAALAVILSLMFSAVQCSDSSRKQYIELEKIRAKEECLCHEKNQK